MSISSVIKQKIEENLQPERCVLRNDSHLHEGHAGHDGGGESHFHLLVVSARFEGCNRIARHRMVYEALGGLFGQGLHALSILALTPMEDKEK